MDQGFLLYPQIFWYVRIFTWILLSKAFRLSTFDAYGHFVLQIVSVATTLAISRFSLIFFVRQTLKTVQSRYTCLPAYTDTEYLESIKRL